MSGPRSFRPEALLDAQVLGERDLTDAEQRCLTQDAEARGRVREHQRRQEAFLQRCPTLEALAHAVATHRETTREVSRAGAR